ncbi:MAG TPA: HAMP domain-containing sensor histidine kinase [Solirubrobacteraceae bacterium]|jgi:two-component system sensor histidine kinase UhpB
MSAESPQRTERRRYVPLLHRVAGVNALLLVVAVLVTIAVLSPNRVSSLHTDEEGIVIVVALVLVVLLNVFLVRRVVRPLEALTALARRVDLAKPGQRMPPAAPTSEAGELTLTFNDMLARLEAERREATGRVLDGQEAERLRIAQELHDQIGQELTAVLLALARVERRVPEELAHDIREVQDAVRGSLEDLRRIAIELRPEALDDLGLESALAVLCERFSERAGLEVNQRIAPDLPELSPEAELVVYRVAQEALTNVARHSGVGIADLSLTCGDEALRLTVVDQGRGLPAGHEPGTGIRGMSERATLIGATLAIDTDREAGGCRVQLDVPLEEPR